LKYYSVKFRCRLDKLKKDIKDNKDELHIKSFLEFLEFSGINVDNLDETDEITMACCEYYKDNKNNKNYLQRFLKHIKKVGSYSASVMDIVMDIVNCARKEKYKTSFSCIDLCLLDSIPADQTISPLILSKSLFLIKRVSKISRKIV